LGLLAERDRRERGKIRDREMEKERERETWEGMRYGGSEEI
jgi:hypothetical protein